MAKNILTMRPRTVVAGSVLESVPASDGSAYREYVLTPKGKALFPFIVVLRQWSEQNVFARGEPHAQMVDRREGHHLRALEVRSVDGRRLNLDDSVRAGAHRSEGLTAHAPDRPAAAEVETPLLRPRGTRPADL